MKTTYIVGLTGGIGSGKSTVAHLFEELGVTVIDADVIARELVVPHSLALKKIVEHFGSDILDHSGQLDRRTLRDRIFKNAAERIWLEQLLHPLILKEIEIRALQSKSPYCIAVIPLLLETPFTFKVNRILVIDTPVELQRQRVQQRDHHSDELIDAILKTQLSRDERLAATDDIIANDKGIFELKQQVKTLHDYYFNLANKLIS